MVAYALLTNHVHTMFGWELQLTDTWNARSLQNYPMQSNGAEMLRAACCMAIDAGVRICAPIHDAVLIEAEEDALEEAIATMQRCMAAASRLILNGFTLQTSVTRIRYPDRFTDARGDRMWRLVLQVLQSRTPVSAWTTAPGDAPARG